MNCDEGIKKLNAQIDFLSVSDARSRIAELFDDGFYTELNRFCRKEDSPCEVITASGYICGMQVFAFSQDISVSCGAMGKAQAGKIKKVYELAAKNGAPVVGIYDSKGAHIDEGMDALNAYGELILSASNLSGVVPQIAVVMGPCIGSAAVLASLADIVIMSTDAQMYVTSGETVSDKQVGSSKVALENATAAIVVQKEMAVKKAVEILNYLPKNNLEASPIADYVPASDSGDFISKITDAQSFFELWSGYSDTAKTGFARIAGNTVGIVSTNTQKSEGRICGYSARKIARFVRICDSFSIPIITLLDSVGFMGDSKQELQGSLKSVAILTQAYAEATTVKITLITGKACGAAFIAMAGKAANLDAVFALPCAVVSTLEPMTAIQFLYKDKLAKYDRKTLEKEFAENEASPFKAAAGGYIDDVIHPDNLATHIAQTLDMLSSKRVSTMDKKHTNLPL